MAGLVPAIHDFLPEDRKNVDGPTKSGHDDWKLVILPIGHH
jgi:hypothetical protein